ncbi:MAG: 4a-hydroxytetrahydrobiopterin dehydratase [Sedimenticola sp.]|nr:4a-hydroxytetrahydrobiopterin dehydratase [Sedimenticola sp.]
MNETSPTSLPLLDRECAACTVETPPLSQAESRSFLSQLNSEWILDNTFTTLTRSFKFNDYYQTIAFTNAVAWIANQQNHHPDLLISYRNCQVSYTTHAINGLSENDFICAAKIDNLINS